MAERVNSLQSIPIYENYKLNETIEFQNHARDVLVPREQLHIHPTLLISQ